MTTKRSHKRQGPPIEVGDTVGITVSLVNKKREITGKRVVARGVVTELMQLRPRARYRAQVDVRPEDQVRWFIHTGHVDWAYVHELVLIKKARKKREVRP